MAVRVGRYGPYLQQGEGRRASLPEGLPPDELTLELASELLRQGELAEEPLGTHPETGQPVYLKTGRYGPYVQLGEGDGDGKPKRASLLRGMDPQSIDLATAVRLLSLPRELGRDPGTGEPVEAHVGRYGQYVKRGKDTRSLPPDISLAGRDARAGARAPRPAQAPRRNRTRGTDQDVRSLARDRSADRAARRPLRPLRQPTDRRTPRFPRASRSTT